MDGTTGRRAVAFAFGPQHGWQRFTVYFLCADGALCALCPVAPFGAAVPASAVQSLAEAVTSSDDLAHSPTTEAWMQQVRPGPAISCLSFMVLPPPIGLQHLGCTRRLFSHVLKRAAANVSGHAMILCDVTVVCSMWDVTHVAAGTHRMWAELAALLITQTLPGPVRQSTSRGAGNVHVRQHALEEHVPRLQGTFPLASAEGTADSLLSFAHSEDSAANLCALRCVDSLLHNAPHGSIIAETGVPHKGLK